MGKSLNDIVSSALSEADHGIKLASARDATVPDAGDFLADELSIPGAAPSLVPAAATPKGEAKVASEDILTDASYAMKLASALDTAAGVIVELNAKVADGGDAASPVVSQAEHQVPLTVPKAQNNSLTAAVASHGGGPQGPQGELQTNKEEFTTPDWTKNKEAAARIINAKVAQAEQLEAVGQLEAAQMLLKEASALNDSIKVAGDPSSPQASLPANSGGGVDLTVDPGVPSQIGDNASLISMTRAGARDKSQREAHEFMSEAPKKDNAVAAHVGKTDGLKLSSEQMGAARSYLKKIASKATDPNASPEERQKAASLIDAVRARTNTPAPEALLS